MTTSNQHIDPDDFFADSRMTFGEHIEDLRTHLLRALKGFLVAVLLAFFLAKWVLAFIQAPVQRQLEAYWDRYNYEKLAELRSQERPERSSRAVPMYITDAKPGTDEHGPAFNSLPAYERVLQNLDLEELVEPSDLAASRWKKVWVRFGDSLDVAALIDRDLKKIRPPTLTTLSVQEAFVVWVWVALMTGFVLGSPWIFYQIWMFIAAGLYPHEKKYVHYFLPFSLALFIGGVLVCEFFVMDKAVEALLWFNEFLGLAPDLRLSEWLGFAIAMPIIFGISFQTPLVMLFIQRIGIVKVDSYRKYRRIIWFLMAVFAAVITPSTDPVSMLLLWVPMTLLFELGIYLCHFLPGQPLLDFDVPEPEEMVEV